ncbi:MAG: phosphodiester glycosidase family protein [Paracoccaceae bacterium]
MLRAALLVALLPGMAQAACRDMSFEDVPYTVCDIAPGSDLRLFLNGPDGPLGSFAAVNDQLALQGEALTFAMNAGMYHADRAPVGLFIEDGRQATPIITSDGPGNFGLLPNGVFCIGDAFAVIEARRFAADQPACRYATQSGPMLVIDGDLHPRFLPDSDSFNIRNGVGLRADGTAVFAISGQSVNFHSFARLFRDALETPNALFLDGSISRLYSPALDRDDPGFPMGPIVGLVTVAN